MKTQYVGVTKSQTQEFACVWDFSTKQYSNFTGMCKDMYSIYQNVVTNGDVTAGVKCCELTLNAGSYILFGDAAFNTTSTALGSSRSIHIMCDNPPGTTYGFGGSGGTGGWSTNTACGMAVITAPATFYCSIIQNIANSLTIRVHLAAIKLK